METERTVKRYSAYYHGWCFAFGEHEICYDEKKTVRWLLGEDRVGLVISAYLKKQLFRALLGANIGSPELIISNAFIKTADVEYVFRDDEKDGLLEFFEFVKKHQEIHMFLTNHFCYPPNTRIITFSPTKPMIIMYKEFEPLCLRILT